MPNSKIKIIYSLRVHIALQQLGFAHMTEMKNPKHPQLNCWVYAVTPELLASLDALIGEGGRKDD